MLFFLSKLKVAVRLSGFTTSFLMSRILMPSSKVMCGGETSPHFSYRGALSRASTPRGGAFESARLLTNLLYPISGETKLSMVLTSLPSGSKMEL
jgi:hypothetical protein